MVFKQVPLKQTLTIFTPAILLILLGASVIFGWYIKSTLLMQVHPSYIAMVYNTALCFLLSGAGLLLIFYNKKTTLYVINFFVFFLSAIVFIQYLMNGDFGVDRLFIDPYNIVATTNPGRMAPDTALAFMLTAMTLTLIAFENLNRTILIVTLILTMLIFIMGFTSFLGYLVNIPLIYHSLGMAAHTALGFLLVAVGLRGVIEHKSSLKKIDISSYRFLEGGVIVLIATLLLWRSISLETHNRIRLVMNQKIESISTLMLQNLGQKINVFYRLDQDLEFHEYPSREIWNRKMEVFFKAYPEIRYVQLMDETLAVRYHATASSVPGSLEDYLAMPLDHIFLKNALNATEPVFIGPLKLKEGRLSGLLILVPNVGKQAPKEYILLLLDLQTLFENKFSQQHDMGFSAAIFVNNHKVYENDKDPSEQEKKWLQERKLDLYGTVWRLQVWSGPKILGELESFLPNVVLILGLILTSLTTGSLYLSQVNLRRAKMLESSQRKLAYTQKLAQLGGWVWDLKKNTIFCPQETAKLMGASFPSTILAPEVFFAALDPREQEIVRKLSNGHSTISKVIKIPVGNDTKYIFFEAVVTEESEGGATEISGVIQDITEQKTLEQRFQHAQKMEIIGQISGGLAHDCNNVLMVIQGNLDLLMSRFSEDSPEAKRIQAALKAVDRGSSLTKRLLTFARQQSLEPDLINLDEFMSNIQKLIRPALGEGVDIKVSQEKDLWQVWADPVQLETALLNLAINARDAMNMHGKLMISSNNVSFDEEIANSRYHIKSGDYVKISVSDTGCGMSADLLERVFEPFFTTKEVGKGSGLGLSQVYGFVAQSGGTVNIYSEKSLGTTVNLYLPRMDTGTPAGEEDQKLIKVIEPLRGHEIILVVEDEEDVRSVTVEYLRELGYKILEAGSGDEALKILKKEKQVDLLFSDVVMPGKTTGFELAAEAKKLHPKIKILFASGYPKNLFKKGFKAPILAKPYRMTQMASKIAEILGKQEKSPS